MMSVLIADRNFEGLFGEARLSCTYKCISPSCYEEIYARDEVVSVLLFA